MARLTYRACWNPKGSSAIWALYVSLPPHYTRKIPGPVRYPFYLAALPPNQTALVSSEEVSESLWLTPKIALEESASGKFPMLPPTIITLRTLAEHGSWQDLCTAFPLR
jgi:hypothetical protein